MRLYGSGTVVLVWCIQHNARTTCYNEYDDTSGAAAAVDDDDDDNDAKDDI